MSILRFSIFRWLSSCDSVAQCKRLFFFWLLIILLQEKKQMVRSTFLGDLTFDFFRKRSHLCCGGLAAFERFHEAAKSNAGEDKASCDQNCVLPSQCCDQPEKLWSELYVLIPVLWSELCLVLPSQCCDQPAILKVITHMTEEAIVWSELHNPIPGLWSAYNSKDDQRLYDQICVLLERLWSEFRAVITAQISKMITYGISRVSEDSCDPMLTLKFDILSFRVY